MLANTGTMLDFPSYNNRLSELTYVNVILVRICIIIYSVIPCLAWLAGIPTQQIDLGQFPILLLSLLRLYLLVKHLHPLQSLLGNFIKSDNIGKVVIIIRAYLT